MSDLSGLSNEELMARLNAPQSPLQGMSDADLMKALGQSPQVSTVEDVAKSGAMGVAQGLIGAAGMGADVSAMGRSALGWLGDQTVGRAYNAYQTGEWNPTTTGREVAGAINQSGASQTSQGLTQSVERLAGPMYQPQTTAGEFARTIGRNVPAAALSPGGAVARTAMAAVPGVAEEAAGQYLKGSQLEPYGRLAAGMAGGLGTVAAQRMLDGRGVQQAIRSQAPTREQLEAAKNAAYRAADDAGVRFTPEAAERLAQSADRRAIGYHPGLQPRTAAVAQDVQAIRGSSPTLSDVEDLRRLAGRAGQTIAPDEREMAGRLTGAIDDFFGQAGPRDVVSGDPAAAVSLLREARANTAAMKRSDTIENALETALVRAEAAHSGKNIDNSIRQRMAAILLDPKKSRGFNEQELEAMRGVVRGEGVNNALRDAGKMLGGGGGLGGAVAGGLGATAGAFVAGPVGAVVGGALGAGGGRALNALANRNTRQSAESLSALVRARSPAASEEIARYLQSNPQKQIDRDALVRALLLSRELQPQPTN